MCSEKTAIGTAQLNRVKQCRERQQSRQNTGRLAVDRSITWTEPDAPTAGRRRLYTCTGRPDYVMVGRIVNVVTKVRMIYRSVVFGIGAKLMGISSTSRRDDI